MLQKYSLWLVPPLPYEIKLGHYIKRFSQLNEAEAFKPHITLLGDIPLQPDEIYTTLATTLTKWTSLSIRLASMASSDNYFMSLYALAEPTSELKAMHKACCQLFKGANIPEKFTPHISLAYGNIDKHVKEHFMDEFYPELPMQFTIDTVQIVKSSNDTPIKDWTLVNHISLNKAA